MFTRFAFFVVMEGLTRKPRESFPRMFTSGEGGRCNFAIECFIYLTEVCCAKCALKERLGEDEHFQFISAEIEANFFRFSPLSPPSFPLPKQRNWTSLTNEA